MCTFSLESGTFFAILRLFNLQNAHNLNCQAWGLMCQAFRDSYLKSLSYITAKGAFTPNSSKGGGRRDWFPRLLVQVVLSTHSAWLCDILPTMQVLQHISWSVISPKCLHKWTQKPTSLWIFMPLKMTYDWMMVLKWISHQRIVRKWWGILGLRFMNNNIFE